MNIHATRFALAGHCSVRPAAVAALLSLLLLPTVRAGWNQTAGGTYQYTDTGNWSGGVIDDQFENNLTAGQAIQFSADRSLTNLTLAPYGTVNLPGLTFQGTGGTRTLTLNGTTRFVPWINVGGAGPIPAFQSTLNLALAGTAPTIVSEYSGSNNSRLRMQGVISGSAGLTTAGRGLIVMEGANTLSGTLNINQGQVRLAEASGALPNVTTINVAAGGRLELGNYEVNNNRLANTVTLNLNGGLGYPQGFESYGNSWFGNFLIGGDDAPNNVAETIGTINLASGLSRVAARVRGTGTGFGDTTLTAGNLTRSAGAAAVFAGGTVAGGSYADLGGYLNSGVGAQSYIKFTTAPTLTGGILPYAVVGSDFGNILAFADYGEFATYDATRGVVAFSRTGTYVTSINGATAGDNVQVTTDGETWTGTRTMNSLNLRHTFAGTFSGGTLTLQSGGLITRNVYGQTQLGALNFNNQEAFVFHSGGHQLQLYGALSGIGANGINFTAAPMHSGGQADTPFIHLYNIGDNSITAPTRILMGTVLLGSGDPLGVSAVTVRQGATLSLPSSATRTLGSLAGAGTVRLSQSEGGTAAGSTLVVGGDNSSTTFSGEIHAGQWYYGRLDNGVLANPGVSGGNLVKTGTGTLTLTGMSTYNGTTTVRQGTLVAGGDVKSTLVYGGGLDTVPSLGSISGNALSGSLANGDRVILQTRYGDVSGWTPGQIYYVVNASGSTFQIADTPGGTAKTISGSNVAWGKLDAAKLVSSAGGDTLTLPSGWSLAEGDVVVFSSVPNLSALVAGIPYHVVDVSGSNFKVSAYAGGAPVRNLPSGSFGVVLPGVLGTGTNAIQVGDASTGSNPVGLLIGGPYTIARDVMVNNFGTGTTLGGNSSGAAAFTGTVTLNKDVNFTAAAGGTVTVSSGIAGTGGVTKIGDGKLQLEAGFLAAGGAVTVSQGTLGIADGVSLGRDVVVNNGARLAPGNSPGVVTVPSLTFDAGAIHQWEIDGVTNDVVNVTGTLDFNFSTPQTMTLELGWLAGGPSIQTNDVFKVFTYGTITGWDVAFGPANPSALFTFTDISGALNVSNAYVWADAANNGTVYLSGVSFVPEPSTLLLLGVGGLLVYRARRAVKLNKQ